ncbi:autotransporter [Thermomicrobium sp. 4228-Ro]|uniref:autotransporter n=1 Tax=Thermomicrobium sp. 4228-Ro TaxID=2993937 RepID=UPI0022496BB1|nr:autotransporter [Thermomicrobium sp. 4228-Ro]MCX2728398.1 autotransporter [Thermomicrobium sp. 4228-Ro]
MRKSFEERSIVLVVILAFILAACGGILGATPTPTVPVVGTVPACPPGSAPQSMTVGPGPLQPRAQLLNALGNPAHYTQLPTAPAVPQKRVLHTFTNIPNAGSVTAAWITVVARPLATVWAGDDGIRVHDWQYPGALFYPQQFSTSLVGTWTATTVPNFVQVSMVLPVSVVNQIKAQAALDVEVHDSTEVKSLTLTVCLPQPTPTPTKTLGVATVQVGPPPLDLEPTPTATPVKKPTVAVGLTVVPLPTPTPTPKKSSGGAVVTPGLPPTPSPTAPLPTPTPTAPPKPTPTSVPTATPTSVPTATLTPTPVPTPTPQPTATPTPVAACDMVVDKVMQPTAQPNVFTVVVTVSNAGSGPCPAGVQAIEYPDPTISLSGPPVISQSGGSVAWSCSGTSCTAASAVPAGYVASFSFTATVNQKPAQNCVRVIVPQNVDVNMSNNFICAVVQ